MSKGFTLIELLIVIALLGLLAAALLAAVDPFEQLKKGNDTALRDNIQEFWNANLRYYGPNAQFPSSIQNNSGVTQLLSGLTSNAVPTLVSQGELKTNYATLIGNNASSIYVTAYTSAGSTQLSVCFIPQSKAFRSDKNTQFNSAGSLPGNCTYGPGNTCYWCIQ